MGTKGERSEASSEVFSGNEILSGAQAAAWVKVLTSFEILDQQLKRFNRTREAEGCQAVTLEDAARRWRVAHVDK